MRRYSWGKHQIVWKSFVTALWRGNRENKKNVHLWIMILRSSPGSWLIQWLDPELPAVKCRCNFVQNDRKSTTEPDFRMGVDAAGVEAGVSSRSSPLRTFPLSSPSSSFDIGDELRPRRKLRNENRCLWLLHSDISDTMVDGTIRLRVFCWRLVVARFSTISIELPTANCQWINWSPTWRSLAFSDAAIDVDESFMVRTGIFTDIDCNSNGDYR